MKKISNYSVLLFSFLVMNSLLFYAQEKEDHYKWFDQLTGVENSGIYNGIEYKENFKVINDKHKFYVSKDFLPASVLYDGQEYFGIEMKYDLYEDNVVIKYNKYVGWSILQLTKDRIDNFTINGDFFVNVKDEKTKVKKGFYKVLLKNQFYTLLKRHSKRKSNRIISGNAYSEFTLKTNYVLLYNETYTRVQNKADIITVFPAYKKEIRAFKNVEKKSGKSNSDNYLISILQPLHALLLKEKNPEIK